MLKNLLITAVLVYTAYSNCVPNNLLSNLESGKLKFI